MFLAVSILRWPQETETAGDDAEDKRIERHFARMLKEQEHSLVYEVQEARRKHRMALDTEVRARFWRMQKEYEVCLQGRANYPQRDVLRRALAVPQGKSEVILTCPGYCQNPVSPQDAQWFYARKGEFLEADGPVRLDGDHVITKDGALILGDMKVKDSGLYSCRYEGHVAVIWLVVVIPKSGYVSKSDSLPLDTQTREHGELNVTAEMQMSPWSPCSRCHDVGKMFRYGVCFLKTGDAWPEQDHKVTVSLELRMLIAYHETGIPCRSEYMAELLKDIPDIDKLADFVEQKKCRVPCSSAEFLFYKKENRTRYTRIPVASALKGAVDVIQRAAPKKFSEKIWVRGNDLYLKCPGVESSQDVLWTKGQIPLQTIIQKMSVFENRISVLEDGRVWIRRPAEEDMGMYACYRWGQKEPSGAVKVRTERGVRKVKTRRMEYVEATLMLVPVTVLLVAAVMVACCTGRHSGEPDTPYT